MITYYEVREQHASTDPRERGAIIKLCKTFAEAMEAAVKLTEQGRNVSVNRSEGWVK